MPYLWDKKMKILAIETSCDETAIALLAESKGFLTLKKNKVYSQIELHKKYGGVVPELAARKHVETIIPMLQDVLGNDKLKNLDYLAVTAGPGLITSLLIGLNTAKALAFALDKPLVPVNHIAGHVYSNWLTSKKLQIGKKIFPALNLVVSGGHTELLLMKDHYKFVRVGQTVDDAVGEAYDKVAKLLGLGYPGGPIVSKLAAQGDPDRFDLPRPMLHKNNFDFSFAGLKTAVLYTLHKIKKVTPEDVADICAGFQAAVIEVLVKKTFAAADKYRVKSVLLSGGVSANSVLREAMQSQAADKQVDFYYPSLEYTTDNAAMISAAAYYLLKSGKKPLHSTQVVSLQPLSNWQLK